MNLRESDNLCLVCLESKSDVTRTLLSRESGFREMSRFRH